MTRYDDIVKHALANSPPSSRAEDIFSGKTSMAVVGEKRTDPRSKLEPMLLRQIEVSGLPMPELQFAAVNGRRFRWDMAWPDRRLLLEVQGGIWGSGAHSRGSGISRDYEKNNAAVINGWSVLYYCSNQIKSGEAVLDLTRILSGKMSEKPLGRTLEDHITDALDWFPSKYVDPINMTGWRPTCYVLAKEVLSLREIVRWMAQYLPEDCDETQPCPPPSSCEEQ